MQNIVEVINLTRRYGDLLALDEISFAIQSGEIVGFLGQNGAGKTTTLRILAGSLAPTSGQVRIAGLELATQALEVRKRIGYLPETVPLYPELRVEEHLRFRAKLKGVPPSQRANEIARVAGQCQIEDRLRQLIGTLSRGYRQRVGLADALLGAPKLLILDEPTSGLDPLQRMEMRKLLEELKTQHTVFWSTHLLHEAEEACSRLLILHRGRLIPEAQVEQIRKQTLLEAVIECKSIEAKDALMTLLGALAQPVEEPVQEAPFIWRIQWILQSDDFRSALLRNCVEQADVQLLELKQVRPSLEAIFREATAQANEAVDFRKI